MTPSSPDVAPIYDKRPQYLSKGALLELADDFGINHNEEILRAELANLINTYIHAHESELIGNDKYKKLFGGRRHRVNETSPSDSLEIVDDVKSAAEGISSRAATMFHGTVKPVIRDVYQAANEQIGSLVNGDETIGQNSVAGRSSQRKLAKPKRDLSGRTLHAVGGLGGIEPSDKTQLFSDISARNLRNVGNTIVSNAEQAAEVIGPVASQMNQIVKSGADRGLAAWEHSGRREAKKLFRQAQAHLSNANRMIVILLFLEMTILLVHILPWRRYDFEIPPSKYSFSAWKRALHYILFFVPERRITITLPSTLAPFSSDGRLALWAWVFWLLLTVVPPFIASHLVTFLPQANESDPEGNQQKESDLPRFDPMVFTIVRLALTIWPLTSACPDNWRNMMEALGSLSGRVLMASLSLAMVFSERMAELVPA
ncbi:hypothetical protein QFC21_002088 [Naganishia friedmannii]|uniref:Uncharacterized protein n=1 Tax=Naganishia friedmannii TaxID=89922 RepID=A0ACC2VYP2_9TREE|nr:hypothetical protein QFC21_002088 [Naganishia friedmannii]